MIVSKDYHFLVILLKTVSQYSINNNIRKLRFPNNEMTQQALAKHQIYALRADLQARGISPDNMIEGISLVDYDGFVKLATEHDKLQSWL